MQEASEPALSAIAFGIRYHPHFTVGDRLGEIIDGILATRGWEPERFPEAVAAAGSYTIMNRSTNERLTVSLTDCLLHAELDSIAPNAIISRAEAFASDPWDKVWKIGDHPAVTRFGCLFGFSIPDDWSPAQALLGSPEDAHSTFVLRYSHRLPVEDAVMHAEINDYKNVIYTISCLPGKRLASVDYQRYFDPMIEGNDAMKKEPFAGFVRDAVRFLLGTGWKYLEERLAQAKAA
jgi:hypothetical protein